MAFMPIFYGLKRHPTYTKRYIYDISSYKYAVLSLYI